MQFENLYHDNPYKKTDHIITKLCCKIMIHRIIKAYRTLVTVREWHKVLFNTTENIFTSVYRKVVSKSGKITTDSLRGHSTSGFSIYLRHGIDT